MFCPCGKRKQEVLTDGCLRIFGSCGICLEVGGVDVDGEADVFGQGSFLD